MKHIMPRSGFHKLDDAKRSRRRWKCIFASYMLLLAASVLVLSLGYWLMSHVSAVRARELETLMHEKRHGEQIWEESCKTRGKDFSNALLNCTEAWSFKNMNVHQIAWDRAVADFRRHILISLPTLGVCDADSSGQNCLDWIKSVYTTMAAIVRYFTDNVAHMVMLLFASGMVAPIFQMLQILHANREAARLHKMEQNSSAAIRRRATSNTLDHIRQSLLAEADDGAFSLGQHDTSGPFLEEGGGSGSSGSEIARLKATARAARLDEERRLRNETQGPASVTFDTSLPLPSDSISSGVNTHSAPPPPPLRREASGSVPMHRRTLTAPRSSAGHPLLFT